MFNSGHSLCALVAAFTLTADLSAQMKFECVKFWVYRTAEPGTTRFWRIGLNDGSHLNTADKEEADQLLEDQRGRLEPMDAFVAQAPGEGLVPLRRFVQASPQRNLRFFYTAGPAEVRDERKRPTSHEIKFPAFVFPHDFKPTEEQAKRIVPVYWFYNPTSGEHFYTTSDKEKSDILRGANLPPAEPPVEGKATAVDAPGTLSKDVLTGKVIAILDGDTIDVLGPEKKPIRIRFDGIDAPEKGQPFATKAKNALGDTVAGKDVRVEIKGEDRYQRKIGVVLIEGTNVNVKLVRDGWAWHFVQYAKDNRELAAAEQEARNAKRGLWADSKPPVAPWDWRKLSAIQRAENRKGAAAP